MKVVNMRSMQRGLIVKVMYMAKNGEVTKRRLKVIKIHGETFQAYCFLRNTKRTFNIENVLVLIPVTRRGSAVI